MPLTLRLVFLIFTALQLFAQGAGSVEVTVIDQSGALIPGAAVSLSSVDNGLTRKGSTTQDGIFVATELQAGRYKLNVSFAGFEPGAESVEVAAGTQTRITEKLLTGKSATSVQVVESSTELQISQQTVGARLTTKELTSIPTSSRNFTHLIVAEPGVSAPLPDRTGKGMNLATSPGGQGDDGSQSLNPSVNGARPTNNSLMINGVDTTNMMNGSGSLGNNINVPLDAIEVVDVQTALYSAKSGRNGGANLHPKLYVQMYQAAAAQDLQHTRELHAQVMRLAGSIYTVGRHKSAIIKGIKCGLSLLGICEDHMAEPFHRFHDTEREMIRERLVNLGLL